MLLVIAFITFLLGASLWSWLMRNCAKSRAHRIAAFDRGYFHLFIILIVLSFLIPSFIAFYLYNPWLVFTPFLLTLFLIFYLRETCNWKIHRIISTATTAYAKAFNEGKKPSESLQIAMRSVDKSYDYSWLLDKKYDNHDSLSSTITLFIEQIGLKQGNFHGGPYPAPFSKEWNKSIKMDEVIKNDVKQSLLNKGIRY